MMDHDAGWYKVKVDPIEKHEIAFYEHGVWLIVGSDLEFTDHDVEVICYVMTPEGELVYHGAEHDPVYNTQQEG